MRRWFLVILLVLPAIWPIVTPGYFSMHDNTQLARVQQMADSLSRGQFPVRWVKDLGYGYGYPIFNFYNPLPYYFGGVFAIVTGNPLVGTQFMFALPVLAAAIGMYLLTRRQLGTLGSLVSAALYTYAPYHAVQIYVRGSVAEYWAYAVLPFLCHFLLSKRTLAAAVSLAVLILSHNLTTIMVLPMLVTIFIIQFFQSKNKLLVISSWLLVTILALGLSAFFWFPATLEKHLTNVDAMVKQDFNTAEHFVYPRQLWSMPWGFGGSTPDEHDGLSFELGKIHIALSVVGILLLIRRRQPNSLLLVSGVLLFMSVFMMSSLSRLIWSSVSILDYLQFPWRWLTFAALGTSILGGHALSQAAGTANKWLPKRWATGETKHQSLFIIFCSLVIIFIFSSIWMFKPQFKYAESAAELLTQEKLEWEYSAASDEYLPAGFITPQTAEEAIKFKNPNNQQLVNDLLKSTPIRNTANLVTLLSIASLATIASWKRLTSK